MNTRDSQHESSPDELQRQARVWLRLLSSAAVTEADGDAFKRWLEAGPGRKQAFNEAKRRWALMKTAGGEYARAHPDALGMPSRRPAARLSPGRRAFLGGAAALAGSAALAVFYPDALRRAMPGEWGADESTAVGEQRTVQLARRTYVTLNTQTSIRHRLDDGKTVGMTLLSGEAAVDLGDSADPFTVAAGPGRAVARAGRFEVRYLDAKACVTCVAGSVEVRHPAGTRILQAHQQMVYDAHAASGIGEVNPDNVAAWRRGELVFNQMRLSEVLAEINRYRAGHVMLVNDAAREQRVTGRFMIASLDAALAQLENTFDLNAKSLPGGLLILS